MKATIGNLPVERALDVGRGARHYSPPFASVCHSMTDKQMKTGLWRGRVIFQTRRFLKREFEKDGLTIRGVLADDCPQSQSLVVVKR